MLIPTSRRGATVVLIAVLMPLFFGLAALTIDVANVCSVKAQLQNAVDAAALAAASGLPDGERVRQRAVDYASGNRVNGAGLYLLDADIDIGVWDSTAAKFAVSQWPSPTPSNAVRVRAELSEERGTAINTFIAGIIGHKVTEIKASATATFATADSWDVIIVQDKSSSFTPALEQAKQADKALVECLAGNTGSDSHVGLVSFTGSGYAEVAVKPIGELHSLLNSIDDLEPCCQSSCGSKPKCSGTNIAAGINLAISELNGLSTSGRPRAIVLVSDGKPHDPSGVAAKHAALAAQAIAAADAAAEQGISVFTVYYAGSSETPEEDAAFVSTLVRGKGTFSSTPDPAELTDLLWKVCSSMPLRLVE
jgi:Flp pilus assembly protein TadG